MAENKERRGAEPARRRSWLLIGAIALLAMLATGAIVALLMNIMQR